MIKLKCFICSGQENLSMDNRYRGNLISQGIEKIISSGSFGFYSRGYSPIYPYSYTGLIVKANKIIPIF